MNGVAGTGAKKKIRNQGRPRHDVLTPRRRFHRLSIQLTRQTVVNLFSFHKKERNDSNLPFLGCRRCQSQNRQRECFRVSSPCGSTCCREGIARRTTIDSQCVWLGPTSTAGNCCPSIVHWSKWKEFHLKIIRIIWKRKKLITKKNWPGNRKRKDRAFQRRCTCGRDNRTSPTSWRKGYKKKEKPKKNKTLNKI